MTTSANGEEIPDEECLTVTESSWDDGDNVPGYATAAVPVLLSCLDVFGYPAGAKQKESVLTRGGNRNWGRSGFTRRSLSRSFHNSHGGITSAASALLTGHRTA